jgi:hypothetical protein
VGLGHPLLDHLACPVEVRARLEDEDDRGEARDRLGADRVDEGDAVEHQRFHRDRDELLHLSRREAEGLGLDLDVWRAVFGKHVDGGVLELEGAQHDDRGGDADDEDPERQAPADDGLHAEPPRVGAASAAVRQAHRDLAARAGRRTSTTEPPMRTP